MVKHVHAVHLIVLAIGKVNLARRFQTLLEIVVAGAAGPTHSFAWTAGVFSIGTNEALVSVTKVELVLLGF